MGFLLDLARGRLTGESGAEIALDVSDADKEAREERAAILEFCAGYSRAEAERVAAITH